MAQQYTYPPAPAPAPEPPVGRMQQLSLAAPAPSPEDTMLLAEVLDMLEQPPLPPRAVLEAIRLLVLQSRSADQPPPPPPVGAPAHRAGERSLNPHAVPRKKEYFTKQDLKREQMIREAQRVREQAPFSFGSQLAAPHPPLNGNGRTIALTAQPDGTMVPDALLAWGAEKVKFDARRGRDLAAAAGGTIRPADLLRDPDARADFRFDRKGASAYPQPTFYSSRPERRR